jgi:hypothetical protein
VLEVLGKHFDLDPKQIEDAMTPGKSSSPRVCSLLVLLMLTPTVRVRPEQMPNVDGYDTNLFFIARMQGFGEC